MLYRSATFSAVSPIVYSGNRSSRRGFGKRQPIVVSWSTCAPRGKACVAFPTTNGARVMLSTPPARYTSPSPQAMACAAAWTACMPDPHRRFTVCPGTVSGRPARSTAMRATLRLSSPAWLVQPITTSSIAAGSSVLRRTTASIMRAARSSGRISRSAPPYRPIGLRTPSNITTSRIPDASVSHSTRERLRPGAGLPARIGGRAFLKERRDAFAVVVGAARDFLQEGFVFERAAQVQRERAVDAPLDEPVGAGGPVGEPRRPLEGTRHQFVLRHHTVHQSEPLGRGRVDRVGKKHHLEGAADADEARQQPRPAGVRDQADAGEHLDEAGPVRRDAQIRGQREVAARTRRDAVDGREDRLLHRPQTENDPVVPGPQQRAERGLARSE